MIHLKTLKEIDIMREAGVISAVIMKEVLGILEPGITTLTIDKHINGLCENYNVTPAFLGYDGYEYLSCICINEEVVHGVPSKRRLKNGDIVTIDFGIKYKGLYSDHARTVGIGKISEEKKKLIDVAYKCLVEGAKVLVAGNHLGDVGYTIHKWAVLNDFNVISEYGGHGIGRNLHEEPFVCNFGFKGEGTILVEGMVLALEPIVCARKCSTVQKKDGWTVVSKPKVLVAHVEDTVAITPNGPEVLTKE